MMLKSERISASLRKKIKVLVFDTVSSTNDIAKELCLKENGDILVIADTQTNGRGRQGKSFFSPRSSGLYLSLAVDTDSPDFNFTGVTCAVAVAVARAIEKLTDLKPQIKWVNDIYIGGKKVCGILAQAVNENGRIKKLVIGVGVNITTANFPDEIQAVAGSLNAEIDRNILAAEITNNIYGLIAKNPAEYIEEYREKSNVIGREIVYLQNNNAYRAKAIGIDEKGGLIIESGGKITTLTSGEISLKFPL